MKNALTTLVARVADFVEFDQALFSNKSITTLDATKWQMAEGVYDSLYARAKKATGAINDTMANIMIGNAMREAVVVVEQRKLERKRLADKKRRDAEAAAEMQAMIQAGVV
jgi:hypothetical protein